MAKWVTLMAARGKRWIGCAVLRSTLVRRDNWASSYLYVWVPYLYVQFSCSQYSWKLYCCVDFLLLLESCPNTFKRSLGSTILNVNESAVELIWTWDVSQLVGILVCSITILLRSHVLEALFSIGICFTKLGLLYNQISIG